VSPSEGGAAAAPRQPRIITPVPVALTPGTRLGPYEVVAQLGAGGMGEVYRATDTNLGRAVAIKVLPHAVAQNADFERTTRSRLAIAAAGGAPWTEDGRYVFFSTRDARRDGISVVRADGAGNPIGLIDQRGPLGAIAVSPDGTQLAFGEDEGGNTDLWTLPIDLSGDTPRAIGEPKVFLNTPFDEDRPAFSKDGRWLAYRSNETGRPELFVRPFPDPGGKVQVSADGVRNFFFGWSPDGKELMYLNLEGQIRAVAYTVSGPTFTLGASRRVAVVGAQDALEDIAPDGKSFAVSTPSVNSSAPIRVTFVVNFFDEIRRRWWRDRLSYDVRSRTPAALSTTSTRCSARGGLQCPPSKSAHG